MRILHVIHSLDPRSGGPSHALRQMVHAQLESGMEAEIVATNVQSAEPWSDDADYRDSLANDPDLTGIKFEILQSYGRSRPWSRYAWTPGASKWLQARLTAKDAPDFVHVHGLFSHITEKAASVSRRLGKPYAIRPAGVLDIGCMKRGRRFLKSTFFKLFAKSSLQSAAFVHATSGKEKQAIDLSLIHI